METSPEAHTGVAETLVREPVPREVERVLFLLRLAALGGNARLLAAVRSHPVERFVAAAAWWSVGRIGMFQLACDPGVDRTTVAGLLIDKVAEAARLAEMETIQFASLLTDDNPWLGILRARGFACARSERSFEVDYQDAWSRIMRVHQRHGAGIPVRWRAEPIRGISPDTALAVIGSHRLLPPAEVCAYWQQNSPHGFTLDLSCVLFDGDRPFGAFLARRKGEVYYIDVQVVQETNPILRSLADLYMMYRMLILHDEALKAGRDVPIRWLRFRSGESEHRQTANLAFRMGGRELSPQRVMNRRA